MTCHQCHVGDAVQLCITKWGVFFVIFWHSAFIQQTFFFLDETGGGEPPTDYIIYMKKSNKRSLQQSLKRQKNNEKNLGNYTRASCHSNIVVLCLTFAFRIARTNSFLKC
jgi:hypothetical protein